MGELVAIYSRKSRFTGKGESIGNQVELCRDYIRRNYGAQWAEKTEIFEDEGFSGGNLNRPDFQKMMEQVRRRRFRAVVVYRLDRISRNIGDFAMLIDELTKLDVAFVSIREQFDTATPMGRAMMFIISVFSQLERETIAERIRDNMLELAKTGRWLGGNTPTGFASESVSRVSVDGKSRSACRLKPVPEEVRTVQLIFDRYLRLDSLTALEAELIKRKVRTKTGRDFSRFTLRAILENPVYMTADAGAYRYFVQRGAQLFPDERAFDGRCGVMPYNRTDQEKGRATVYLPVTQWIVAPGKHPGLIPSEQWIRVQESLERNSRKSYGKARKNRALLTGLIFCSCGGKMYPRLTGSRTKEGSPSFSYVCTAKERSGKHRCQCANANGVELDGGVLRYLGELKPHRQTLEGQLRKELGFLAEHRQRETDPLRDFHSEIAGNQRRIDGLLECMSLAESSDVRQQLLQRVEQLTQANRTLEQRIREEKSEKVPMAEDGLPEISRSFSDILHRMDLEGQREAVRQLVGKVIWDGSTAQVYLFGAELPDVSFSDTGEDSK